MTKPKRRRITPAARNGLRAMAGYWMTCLDSWGAQFEGVPRGTREVAEINAALAYLGMETIDLSGLDDDEPEGD
jgi:hypothetical protein